MRLRSKLLNFVNLSLVPTGFELRRYRNYIDINDAIKKAHRSGKSLLEYLEELWNEKGNREFVINKLDSFGVHAKCNEVVEIGPGTGMFLEMHMQKIMPVKYHIYETERDCKNYLAKKYNVVPHDADGFTLSGLEDDSCGLCVAHGVFVYLSSLNCFRYFKEMARVCEENGFVVFDIYADRDWDQEYINAWLNTEMNYPVILPQNNVIEFFTNMNCKLVGSFMTDNPFNNKRYFIFRKLKIK